MLYVDERGQGRSERVDPTTFSLDVFARDVDLLAEALELERFALLGHSFGADYKVWSAKVTAMDGDPPRNDTTVQTAPPTDSNCE